jgi:hypothetical protein
VRGALDGPPWCSKPETDQHCSRYAKHSARAEDRSGRPLTWRLRRHSRRATPVAKYNDGWDYTAGAAAFAAKAQVKDGIIANGPDGVLGDFDLGRVNALIKALSPIYAKEGKTPKAGLVAQDIVTNQFINPSIHLPSS